nr:MAG TPA: hypothetical protein [Caudoviricetes sp.]
MRCFSFEIDCMPLFVHNASDVKPKAIVED